MAIHLQERDIALLRLLADNFLLLTREQIQLLIPRRVRRTNQRLSILVNAGYISRRAPQDAWEPRMVFYYLGEKAGDVLHRDRTEILERRNRAENYKTAFLKHLYQIDTIQIRFWKYVDEGYTCRKWIGSDNAFWDSTSLGLRPDSYVEFRKDDKDFSCFIEMDRGTERGEYIRSKIADYHRYDLSGEFRGAFQMDWFRVLFVVEQASRAKMLSRLFPSDTFLVATLDQVCTKPLLAPYWLAKAKKETSLLDTSEAELRAKERKDREREEEIEELETPPPAPKPPPTLKIDPKNEPEKERPSFFKRQFRYWEWGLDVLVAGIAILGFVKLILIILSAISNLRDSLTGYVR
jgi:hypothetical protein